MSPLCVRANFCLVFLVACALLSGRAVTREHFYSMSPWLKMEMNDKLWLSGSYNLSQTLSEIDRYPCARMAVHGCIIRTNRAGETAEWESSCPADMRVWIHPKHSWQKLSVEAHACHHSTGVHRPANLAKTKSTWWGGAGETERQR